MRISDALAIQLPSSSLETPRFTKETKVKEVLKITGAKQVIKEISKGKINTLVLTGASFMKLDTIMDKASLTEENKKLLIDLLNRLE